MMKYFDKKAKHLFKCIGLKLYDEVDVELVSGMLESEYVRGGVDTAKEILNGNGDDIDINVDG